MTDPDAVARALSRLAVGAPRTREHRGSPEPVHSDAERIVDDAEAAIEQVDRAAAFLDAGGEARLQQAIQHAESRGETPLASRGRTVLTALDAFRAAASDESPVGSASERQTTSTPLAQRSSGEGS